MTQNDSVGAAVTYTSIDGVVTPGVIDADWGRFVGIRWADGTSQRYAKAALSDPLTPSTRVQIDGSGDVNQGIPYLPREDDQ